MVFLSIFSGFKPFVLFHVRFMNCARTALVGLTKRLRA